MREIKFRAWDKKAKIIYPNIQNHIGNNDTAFGYMIKNDRYVIMQYTGLKDKKDKEIYEGDIVTATRGRKGKRYTTEVVYKVPLFMLKENETIFIDSASLTNTIVIGNIYENPELQDR